MTSPVGLYPVAGQDPYLLNHPYFQMTTIRNEVIGSAAIIITPGLSAQNKYIQLATLNSKPYTKNWILHDWFQYRGTLKFMMDSSTEGH
jgi:putative alpha-1,2-mannosidase